MGILKASALPNSNSTYIMGRAGSGKSYHAIELTKDMGQVLWVNLSNIPQELPGDYDVALISDWTDFMATVVNNADIASYDAVVIDGLSTLALTHAMKVFSGAAANKAAISQQTWLQMGRMVTEALTTINVSVPALLVTSLTVTTDTGEESQAINRYLNNSIIDMFTNKHYTYVKPLKVDGKNAGVSYNVETNPSAAIRLKPLN